MTATGRAGPFGELLRIREAVEWAIFELAGSRTHRPAGKSNDELTNDKSKSIEPDASALSFFCPATL